jgi:hypothetical protein
VGGLWWDKIFLLIRKYSNFFENFPAYSKIFENFPAYSFFLNFFPLFENFGGKVTHSAPYMYTHSVPDRALRVSPKI